MSSPREHWGLSCPNGGKFYICEDDDTQFMGCCVSDPCGSNKGKCPDGDLRATTFDKDLYEDLPTQDCDNSQGTDNWYTCAFLDPPFIGCCSQNACGSGCPRNRLVGAKLSKIENNRLDFLEPRADSTSTTASETASSTSSATAEPTSDSDEGLSTGATAGIAVGAAVGGLLVIALLAWLFWWKPRQKKNGQEFQSVPAMPAMAGHGQGQPGTPGTFATQPTFPAQSPMSSYQPTFSATSPNPAAHYPSGVSSMDQFSKYSPQTAQFEQHQGYGHYPDGSVPATSPGLPAYGQQYPPQMAPVMEMDATPAVAHEMGTGQEHQITSNSPGPDHNKQGEGLGISK